MTGRAAGYCAGYSVPGYTNSVMGRGVGFGWGRGAGRGRGMGIRRGCWTAPPAIPYNAAPTREQELEMLKSQAEGFEQALKGVREQILEVEKQGKE